MKNNTRLLIKLNVVADIFLIFTAFFAITTFAQSCNFKNQGDADCNGRIDLIDYESWRREFLVIVTTKSADFNTDTRVDLVDYESWRRSFTDVSNPSNTPTPQPNDSFGYIWKPVRIGGGGNVSGIDTANDGTDRKSVV